MRTYVLSKNRKQLLILNVRLDTGALTQTVVSHMVHTRETLAEEWEYGDDDSSVFIFSLTFGLLQLMCAQVSGFMDYIV